MAEPLKNILEKELKMCEIYSHYHSTLYYINNTKSDKANAIIDTLNQVINSFNDRILRSTKRFNMYEITFKNGSRLIITPCKESLKGYRNHHAIIDVDISRDSIQTIILPKLLSLEVYNRCFDETVEQKDEGHFGRFTMVTIK